MAAWRVSIPPVNWTKVRPPDPVMAVQSSSESDNNKSSVYRENDERINSLFFGHVSGDPRESAKLEPSQQYFLIDEKYPMNFDMNTYCPPMHHSGMITPARCDMSNSDHFSNRFSMEQIHQAHQNSFFQRVQPQDPFPLFQGNVSDLEQATFKNVSKLEESETKSILKNFQDLDPKQIFAYHLQPVQIPRSFTEKAQVVQNWEERRSVQLNQDEYSRTVSNSEINRPLEMFNAVINQTFGMAYQIDTRNDPFFATYVTFNLNDLGAGDEEDDQNDQTLVFDQSGTFSVNQELSANNFRKRENFQAIYDRQKNKFKNIPLDDVLVLFVFRALGYHLVEDDRQKLGLAFESVIKNEFVKEVFRFHRVVFPYRNKCGKNEEAKRVQKSLQKRLKKNLDIAETTLACKLMTELRNFEAFSTILSKNSVRKKFITEFSNALRHPQHELLTAMYKGDQDLLFRIVGCFSVFSNARDKKDWMKRARAEFARCHIQYITKNRFLKIRTLAKIQTIKSFKNWCDFVRKDPVMRSDVLFKHKIYRHNILENLFEALLRHLVEYINALNSREHKKLKDSKDPKDYAKLVHVAKAINNSYKIRGFQVGENNRRTLKMMVHRGMALESCRYFIWKITNDENGTWKRKSWKIIPLNKFCDVLGKSLCGTLLTPEQIKEIQAKLEGTESE